MTVHERMSVGDWRPNAGTIAAIVRGEHGDPFAVLGPHVERAGAVARPGLVIRAFEPGAVEASVIDAATGKAVASLERLDADGFFAGPVPGRSAPFPYRLAFRAEEQSWERDDAYRFPSMIGEMDVWLMAEGTHQRIYERLGAHPVELEGVAGTIFAVWAPNARRVSVIGDFNFWDGRRHIMRKRHEAGIWELFVPGVSRGALYKYEIIGVHGHPLPQKSDPVGFEQEHPPSTASRVHGLIDYPWTDDAWMAKRQKAQALSAPISIYEVHLGSWRRGDDNRFLNYDEIGDHLVPYLTEMGFTHVEFMPVSEFPFAGSWGYQPIGLFSPTSRFGPPEGFARLVDRLHKAGIGVIIDWVPAHFPSDAHGLVRFDGTALYEHEDPRLGFHRDWNTLIYNFGRREVANFLEANALFWLERYHLDALRVDAVASMLYLDYSRQPGEWLPNNHGGRENLEAVAFLQSMNTRVFGTQPGATTMAEESTAWPGVSRPVDAGGLGFGYKWNMGWMHDTLNYMSQDPIHRRYHHHQLTFGIHYGFTENFILPLSHDEVVHGKGSLIAKMPGDGWQKFANLRAYFGFMWTHPGKKLLFMGGEFAQGREWNHDQSLDWHLLDHEWHRGVQLLVRDLNRLYRELPALHQKDCDASGFRWVEWSDADNSVISYLRFGEEGEAPVLVVSNFTPVVRYDYCVGVPLPGRWRERLNTDAAVYGGSGVGNGGDLTASAEPRHDQPHSLALTVPPLATIVFEHSEA